MKLRKKHYKYATIKITEYYDEIEEPKGCFALCNRFWGVSLIEGHQICSIRCDSRREFIDFLKEELSLIPNKKKVKE